MKVLNFIFTCIVLFLTISFAISNKQTYELTLWPFPFSMELPISFSVLVFSLAFFILGGAYAWLITLPVRAERFHLSRQVKDLNKQIDELKSQSTKD
ncbi:MAG: LapA family protein [Alphaproteobacteria bacterium]|nr:LapA family protein [Alphaproteobacteria bacterium]